VLAEVQTISGCGFLQSDDPNTIHVEGGNLVGRLIQQATVRFAKRSRHFHDVVHRLPFVFGEKSLNSVLLPSLGDHAGAVTTEYPIRRGSRRRDSGFGFLDYWVFHHGRLLLVEVKQAWVNPSTRSVTDRIRWNWRSAIGQTDSIPLSNIRQDLDDIGLNTSKVFRVPLLIAPFLSTSSDDELLEYEQRMLLYRHEILRNELTPRPNFSALWLLKRNLQGPYPWWSGGHLRFATFSAVAFYSWIHRRS